MASANENQNFFGFADDKLIYDERKKRFVHTQDMPGYLSRQYQNNQFKSQRPDLTGAQAAEFEWKLRFGQQMIRYMNYQTKLEMRRLWTQMGQMSYLYFYPLMDDYMCAQAMDRPKMTRLWTWDDSTKIVNFMTMHLMQAEKYGLDIPIQNSSLWTKDELKNREDDLTEYFLYEMRKPKA